MFRDTFGFRKSNASFQERVTFRFADYSFDITGNPYFQNDFYILFNLAVGGSFTGIYDIEGITAVKDGQTASMYIDWIKVTKIN